MAHFKKKNINRMGIINYLLLASPKVNVSNSFIVSFHNVFSVFREKTKIIGCKNSQITLSQFNYINR